MTTKRIYGVRPSRLNIGDVIHDATINPASLRVVGTERVTGTSVTRITVVTMDARPKRRRLMLGESRSLYAVTPRKTVSLVN